MNPIPTSTLPDESWWLTRPTASRTACAGDWSLADGMARTRLGLLAAAHARPAARLSPYRPGGEPPDVLRHGDDTVSAGAEPGARAAGGDRAGRDLGVGIAGLAAGRGEPVPPGRGGRHHGTAGTVTPAAVAAAAGQDDFALADDRPAAGADGPGGRPR